MGFIIGFLLGAGLSSTPTPSRVYTPQEIYSYQMREAQVERAHYCGIKPARCVMRQGCTSEEGYARKLELREGICNAG